MNILAYKKINFTRIHHQDPMKKGNYLLTQTFYKFNNDNIPILIQTPKLKTDIGIVNNESRSYIEFNIDESQREFYDFLYRIDELNISITHQNSNSWFEQNLPLDIIDDLYISPIKVNKVTNKPVFKLKVPIYKTKKGCEVFSNQKIPIDILNIKKIA